MSYRNCVKLSKLTHQLKQNKIHVLKGKTSVFLTDYEDVQFASVLGFAVIIIFELNSMPKTRYIMFNMRTYSHKPEKPV